MQQIQLPVTQVGLEQSIATAMQRASRGAQINLGVNARQINAISQPLGRITGQADDFAKSMSAANARVLAFGASVGIMGAVTRAMQGVVQSAREVESSLTAINTILNVSSLQLQEFGEKIFDVAKNTGQTFAVVAEGALELSRQGLSAEETLKRLNDALILSRLSGLDSAKSVEGLTAAYNSFVDSGISTEQILNKLVGVAQKFAVSERDLIEGLKRSASVANQAGVSFDELLGIITAVQERTARGGAVIGNSFKTIFARIQDKAVLADLQDLGIQVTDLEGKLLPATTILQNLSKEMDNLTQVEQVDLAKKLGGVFQLSNLLAALKDLSSENSKYAKAVQISLGAADEAYKKNAMMNETLDALINRVSVSAQQLGATLGEIGVTDSIKNLLGFFNSLLEGVQKILGEESALGNFFRGLVKGIGNLITGPGLALFGAIILKLSKDLVQFGFSSLKSFFGIGKAAKEIKDVETSIQQVLSRNLDLQQKLFSLEGNRAAQLKVITDALIQQEAALRRSASTAASLAPALYNVGGRASGSGLRINPPKTAAEGFMPAVAQEKSNIRKGVGGAKSGDKPVVIPNFSFGGGKRGTMVAHTGEYIVPNFAGGGSAIFNRDMVRSMGMPSGAKKINAAGGFIPNFVREKQQDYPKPQDSVARDLYNAGQYTVVPSARGGTNSYLFEVGGVTQKMSQAQMNRALASGPKGKIIQVDVGGAIGILALSDEGAPRVLANAQTSDFSQVGIDALKKSGIVGKETTKENAPTIAFKNIAVSSLQNKSGDPKQQASAIQTKFRESVNRLFVKPAQQLSRELFDGVFRGNDLSDYEVQLAQSKDIFSESVLGGIFESSVNLATKAIAQLPAFGAEDQNRPFDFEEGRSDVSQEFKKNFFPQAPNLKKADAKKSINDSTIRDIIKKSVRDDSIRNEVLLPRIINRGVATAGGYIPNFASVYDKFKVDPKAQGSLKVKDEKSTPFTAKKNIWDFVDNPEAKRKLLVLSDSFDKKIGSNDFWFRGTDVNELKNLLSKGQSSSVGINDQTNSGATFFASSFGKAASYGLRGVTGDKVDNGVVLVLKKQFLKNKTFDTSPFEQEKENSIRLFGRYFKEDLEGVVDLRSGNFIGIDKLGIKKNAAQGYIPNFADSSNQGRKTSIQQILQGLGAAGVKILIDQYLGDGFVDAFEASGISRMKPKDAKLFIQSLVEQGRGTKAKAFETALMRYPSLQKAFPQQYNQLISKKGVKVASRGFLPNFSNPLEEAIGREMSAGVPASQIYVDRNPRLKNAMNPMGLMVANRRDEPAGGYQGVNRALKEGRNPQTYGASRGFVPNYAAQGVDLTPYLGQGREAALSQESQRLEAAKTRLTSQIELLTTDLDKLKNASGKIRKGKEKQALAIQKSIQAAEDERAATVEKSKATRAAITEQTKGVLGTGRTLRGTKATITEASPSAKGPRDLLGTIFAVQAGLSLLTGATSDATSGLAKYTNVVASGLSTATSTVFAFQGLSSALPQFAKVLGPAGLAIGAATATYQILTGVLNEYFGVNKLVAQGLYEVSKAAEAASVNLSKLTPEQQEEVKEEGEKLLREGLKIGTRRVSGDGAFSGDTMSTRLFTEDVYAEYDKKDVTGKLAKSVQDRFTEATATGVQYSKLQEAIKKVGADGLITLKEAESLPKTFARLIRELEASAQTAIEGLKKNSELEKILAGMSVEDIKKQTGSSPMTQEELASFAGYNSFAEYRKENYQFKNVGNPKTDPIGFIKGQLIASGGYEKDSPALDVRAEEVALELRLKGQNELEAGKNAIQTANLAVLQAQLDNRIAYNNALFEATTEQEYSLRLQKELLSVGEAGRFQAETQLENLAAAKKLTIEQANATLAVLKDSSLIQRKLEAAGTAGIVDPDKFEEIAAISENINALILQQGGYTRTVVDEADDLLEGIGIEVEQRKAILDLILEKNKGLKLSADLQKQETALSKIQLATLEASNFILEKRSKNITQGYDSLSKSAQLEKRRLDIELEAFKIQKERQKIGSSAARNLSIDREIVNREKFTIDAKLKIDQQDLLNQLKKTLAETALSVGISPDNVLFGNIKKATTEAELQNIVKTIEDAEKEVKINKIEAALQETTGRLELLKLERDSTIETAKEFKKIIVEAAKEIGLSSNYETPYDSLYPASSQPISEIGDAIKRAEAAAKAQIEALRNQNNTSTLQTDVDEFLEAVKLSAAEAANQVGALDNSLISAGDSLQTFANLVRDVFRNLPENIEQNKFSLLTATDAQSIIGNALESRRNSILQQGPENEDTIIRAYNDIAIYEKELDIKRAISSEDKARGELELRNLKEILPLKMELLAADTDDKKVAIIEQIIQKEKQRLTLAERLRASLMPTDEEMQIKLEDSLVSSSVQFRDNLIDGISRAIEGGESLGDVLRNAALEFAREITKASIQNVVGKIGGFFQFANGGKVKGGSGIKDDVPAMLMGGEYVVKKQSVNKYGSNFLEAINNGTLMGYAQGGMVQRGPQGNFYTPGTYGKGAIEGKKDLLDFATQSGTSGEFDRIVNQAGFSSIALSPESSRLSVSGMRKSPMFEATQSAKQNAFGLYLQQYNQEIEESKRKKEQKKALRRQLLMLVGTAVLSMGANAALSGAKAAIGSLGEGATFSQKLAAGLKGSWSGGNIMDKNVGGLKSLFSGFGGLARGDFKGGSDLIKLSTISSEEQRANALKKGGSSAGAIPKIGRYPLPDGWDVREVDKILPPVGVATGGLIPSYGGIDTVPAMLSGGEFVLNRASVQNIGAGNLQSMNSGASTMLTEEKSKELNEKLIAKLDELIQVSGSSGDITINISGSQESQSQQGGSDQAAARQQLARQVKDAVMKVIEDEKRLGGQLRRR